MLSWKLVKWTIFQNIINGAVMDITAESNMFSIANLKTQIPVNSESIT